MNEQKMSSRCFYLTRKEYALELRDLEPEMAESYGEKICLAPHLRADAIYLSAAAVAFAKEQTEEYRNISFVLKLLALGARTREVRFLLKQASLYTHQDYWAVRDHFLVKHDPKAFCMMIRYAARLTYYHYRVFSAGYYSRSENSTVNSWMEEVEKHTNLWLENMERFPSVQETIPSPMEIYQHLSGKVIGQDHTLKAVAMDVSRFLRSGERLVPLLIGPSGSGKTYTMESLRGIPYIDKHCAFMRFDMSGYTAAGYQGGDMKDIQRTLRYALNGKDKIFCFLDEFDKACTPNTNSMGEDFSKHVQFEMLSWLEGIKSEEVDFSKVFFFLGGAFSQLEVQRKDREEKHIGFLQEEQPGSLPGAEEASIREELIGFGLMPEILGRIHRILLLNRLSPSDLKAIMLHKDGVIQRKKKLFKGDNLEIEFEEEALDVIAQKVWEENLGARSVENIVSGLIDTLDFDMLANGYKRLIFSADAVRGKREPLLKRN